MTAFEAVTVAVCTRNRAEGAVQAVDSVLANRHPVEEILVIDQSTADDTQRAFQDAGPRVRYHRTPTVGLSTSRNIALAMAKTEIVLFTDDDCVVDEDWVAANLRAFTREPSPALVFGDVIAAEDDSGYSPESVAERDFTVDSVWRWRAPPDGVNIGIGASMGVRRSAVEKIGGFDERLGAGADFQSAEDTDISLRLVLGGRRVARVTAARVVHFGTRSHDDFRSLTRGAMFGIGATCGKLLRSDPLHATVFVAQTWWRMVLAPALHALSRLRRPPVLGRAVHFAQGLWSGLRAPVDTTTNTFRPPRR